MIAFCHHHCGWGECRVTLVVLVCSSGDGGLIVAVSSCRSSWTPCTDTSPAFMWCMWTPGRTARNMQKRTLRLLCLRKPDSPQWLPIRTTEWVFLEFITASNASFIRAFPMMDDGLEKERGEERGGLIMQSSHYQQNTESARKDSQSFTNK